MEGEGAPETKGNALLRVYPPAVEFVGVEFGPLYVLTVSVQNADSKVRRVRIQAPSSPFFRLSYFPDTAVAPGPVRAPVVDTRAPPVAHRSDGRPASGIRGAPSWFLTRSHAIWSVQA